MTFAFFATVLSVWAGMHVWVGRRLTNRGSSYPRWARRSIWAALLLLFMLPLLAFLGPRAALFGQAVVQWVGFSCMGVSSLLITFTLAIEVPRLLLLGGMWLRERRRARAGTPAPAELLSPRRRQFFADLANYGIVGGATGLSVIGFGEARRVPRVVEVDVPIADLHPDLDGFRIVQLTDVHVGPTIRGSWLTKVVDVVNTLDADLVALTGDFVDGNVLELSGELESLARVQARHGSYFVTGNHEYYWDGPAWCEAIAAIGPTVLINEHRVLEHGGARLVVAGVTDHGAARRVPGHATDPGKAKAGAPAHDFSLLLAHQPRSIDGAAAAGFDLQLSGHTHAGQYFPGSVLIYLAQPYVSGLALHPGTRTHIYVSRGTGYWGPPNRAGSPSEISLLILRRAA